MAFPDPTMVAGFCIALTFILAAFAAAVVSVRREDTARVGVRVSSSGEKAAETPLWSVPQAA